MVEDRDRKLVAATQPWLQAGGKGSTPWGRAVVKKDLSARWWEQHASIPPSLPANEEEEEEVEASVVSPACAVVATPKRCARAKRQRRAVRRREARQLEALEAKLLEEAAARAEEEAQAAKAKAAIAIQSVFRGYADRRALHVARHAAPFSAEEALGPDLELDAPPFAVGDTVRVIRGDRRGLQGTLTCVGTESGWMAPPHRKAKAVLVHLSEIVAV